MEDGAAFDSAVGDLKKYLGAPQGTVHVEVMEALVSGLADAHFNEAQQVIAGNPLDAE